MGPAASQIAIKQLGTNGGGFFNVNSAHPFENPTPLSNFARDAGDPADPRGALLHVRPHGERPQARLGAAGSHAVLFVPLLLVAVHAEQGNMEGKEVRFGTAQLGYYGRSRPPRPPTDR